MFIKCLTWRNDLKQYILIWILVFIFFFTSVFTRVWCCPVASCSLCFFASCGEDWWLEPACPGASLPLPELPESLLDPEFELGVSFKDKKLMRSRWNNARARVLDRTVDASACVTVPYVCSSIRSYRSVFFTLVALAQDSLRDINHSSSGMYANYDPFWEEIFIVMTHSWQKCYCEEQCWSLRPTLGRQCRHIFGTILT